LQNVWPESFSVNAVNLVKKIRYNSRDRPIEFFLGDYFLLAHSVGLYAVDNKQNTLQKHIKHQHEN